MPAGSIAVSYRQHALDDRYDAIVIGSGIGGLTAAVLLARHGGRRVLVLERHYAAGGFTHVFRRSGFEWDVGVHYVGGLRDPNSPVRIIFDNLTEGRLEWGHMPEVYDRIFLGDRCYDLRAGRESFRQAMRQYFPGEARGIDLYMAELQRCVRRSMLYFAERAAPPFIAGPFGGLMRYPFLRYARRTTSDVLSSVTANRELQAVLAGQWGDYGLPPGQSSFGMHAIVADHYLDGGSYPDGGSARIAEAMAPAILRAGGHIVIGAEVQQILADARNGATGVRMADGREFHAGCVISDAGASNTFQRLLPAGLPGIDRVVSDIGAVPPSLAHLCLYVGLEGAARDLGLSGTNLWIYPDEDHDGNLQRFLADPESAFPVVYISFPSAKDPSFEERYPGRSTIDVITLASYDWFRQWQETAWKKRASDYEGFKHRLADRLLEILYRHVPSARGHVVHAELSTPLSTRYFMNYPQGEIYGLAHTPRRFELRRLAPRTPVRNLFLTGQDASVCGVMGATSGGILAASSILGRNLFSVVSRR